MNANKRGFSLYDIEEFLKEAGAERVNEKAVFSLEKELNDTVKQLVEDAVVYANYAGRKRIIKRSDIALARSRAAKGSRTAGVRKATRRTAIRRLATVSETSY